MKAASPALLLAVLFALGLAPAARAASISLDQSPIILGRVDSVGVTVRVEEPPGSEVVPLRLSVNVGSFGEVTRAEPGVYRAVYTPPPTRFPQVALVAAWRETGPEAPIDFLRIPLWGTTRIDAQAPPGFEVRVAIGAAEFGPVTTGARGTASVPVDVPPGVPEAVVRVKEKTGRFVERRAAVSVPPYNRLTGALGPHAILANGEDWARVEVFYDSPTRVSPQGVVLEPSEGSATLLSSHPNRFVYKYLAPPGSVSREVSFKVGLADDPAAVGTASLGLGLAPPAEIVLTPPDEPVVCDGRSFAPVLIRVWDARRNGLPHQNVEVMANGQRVREVVHRGGGVYEARFVAPAAWPEQGLVRLSATVTRPDGQSLGSTATYQVLPLPLPASLTGQVVPRPLPADGRSQARVTLDVRDKAGLPLRGARLIALPGHGSAGPVVEVGEGRYRVDYVAPAEMPPGWEALIKVVDSTNAFEAFVPVPLRSERRLMLGLRGGFGDALGNLAGPRGGLDALVPLRLGEANFCLEAIASAGAARQEVAQGDLRSTSRALFLPLALRAGWAPHLSQRTTVYLGAGALAVWASVGNDLNGYDATAWGFGGQGFASGALELGPGQLFLDLSFGFAPVRHADFRLEGGGLEVAAGYRLGVF